jgi:histone H1/5
LPDYGTIDERMRCHQEGVEFKDPSGKSPTAYSIVMKKLKLTKQEVEEEAGKFNIKLSPNHFVEVASKKSGRPPKADKKEKGESKPKGRPKKSKKVLELAGEEEDLFASLVMSANKQDVSDEEEVEIESNDDSIEEQVAPLIEEKKAPKKEPKKKVSEEEKEAAKAAKEAEKEAAKAAKEAEKEAAKAAKKAEKEAEKEAAKAAKKAEKEAEKGAKKVAEKVEKKATQNESQEDDEEADVVKKIEFEGKKYLKSKKTGIVYNMEQDVIGKWNESKQRIDFDEVDEEIADEYEE